MEIEQIKPKTEVDEIEGGILLLEMHNENGKKSTGDGNEADIEPAKREADIEESQAIRFSPPVYIQRYLRVIDILKESIPNDGDLKTIFEIGCAEFSMHVYLSKLEGVGRLIYLDLDEGLLNFKKEKLRPLVIDHLHKRETPLRVEAYAGCVTKVDPKVVQSVYAVVGIEIVEHLDEPILDGLVKSVFGVTKPEIVVLTTPNSEFNVNFNLPPGKFRHWDHRFEWTRTEFEVWCKSVIQEFPSYEFTLEGIGKGPDGTEAHGCVSQMSVFRKVKDLGAVHPESLAGIVQENSYKLISGIDYPFFLDTTPTDERIVRQFKYYVNCYLMTPNRIEEYIASNTAHISLAISWMQTIHGMPKGVTQNQITSALSAAGYKILDLYDFVLDGKVPYVLVNVPENVPEDSEEEDMNIENLNVADDSPRVDLVEEEW